MTLLGQAVDVAIKNAVVALTQGRDSVTTRDLFLEAYEVAVDEARSPIRCPARYDREKLSDMGERLITALEPVLPAEDRVKRIVAHDIAFTIPLLDENDEPMFDTPLVGIFDFVEEMAPAPNREKRLVAGFPPPLRPRIHLRFQVRPERVSYPVDVTTGVSSGSARFRDVT